LVDKLIREHIISQKRNFAEKLENSDRASVSVRVRVRAKVRIRTCVFIDLIVCFMAFLRHVFSARCRRPDRLTLVFRPSHHEQLRLVSCLSVALDFHI